MDENWYTNESVWSLSFFYPDPQEDKKKEEKKKNANSVLAKRGKVILYLLCCLGA